MIRNAFFYTKSEKYQLIWLWVGEEEDDEEGDKDAFWKWFQQPEGRGFNKRR